MAFDIADYAISPAYGLAKTFPKQASAFKDTLFGTPGQFKMGPNQYSPQQQQFLNQALQMGQQGLGTDAIEGKARRGFQNSTIPLLSERFAQQGGIGSSGYQNALQGAGTELETNLAAQRQGNALNLAQLGLTQQSQPYFEPGRQGILGPLINAGAQLGSAYLSGGATLPGSLMSYFSGLFGNNQQQEQQPLSYSGADAIGKQRLDLQNQTQAMSPLQLLATGAPGQANSPQGGFQQGGATSGDVSNLYKRLSAPQQYNAAQNLDFSPMGFQRQYDIAAQNRSLRTPQYDQGYSQQYGPQYQGSSLGPKFQGSMINNTIQNILQGMR